MPYVLILSHMAPSDTLTLAEVVSAVAEPDQRELVARRLRHWTLAGIVPAAGEVRSGTGRHRRYQQETVYLVAVLNELAGLGLPIKALFMTSGLIQELLRDENQHLLWDRAKIDPEARIFLWCILDAATDQEATKQHATGEIVGMAGLEKHLPFHAAPLIVNLSYVLAGPYTSLAMR